MVNRSEYVDQAGMTLVVKGINISDTPGDIGTPADLGGGSIPDPLEVDDVVAETVTADSLILDGADPVTLTAAVVEAGDDTGAAGNIDAAFTHVLEIDVDGTPYFIPLCATNASAG